MIIRAAVMRIGVALLPACLIESEADGFLVTGFAVSQEAPFWFDVLNKFMVVRSMVKPAEKGGEQASKNRPSSQSMVDPCGTENAEPPRGSGAPPQA